MSIVNVGQKFDFNDILIVPKIFTHIKSRYKNIELSNELPLMTAPMDTVVNTSNAHVFLNRGITVVLPRTVDYNTYYNYVFKYPKNNIFWSVGFEDLDNFYDNNFKHFPKYANICIDTANGHMLRIIDYCREIKRLRPDIKIMVGNIANPETYSLYAKYDCVDYIRIGIGNGNGCLTTKQSGIGFPMASLISEVYEQKQEFIKNNDIDIKHQNSILKTKPVKTIPAIVADGGMKDYADIIKALALGADYVMIGSIFNKALESCADNYLYGIKLNNKLAKYFFDKGYPVKKYFRGMSTKAAQKAMGKTEFKTSEGIVRFRKVEYHLDGWVNNFNHYLRNAMSYTNSKKINDFIGNIEICEISKSAYDRFNK
jgi:hypothetical protein